MITGTEVLERGLWGQLAGAFAHKLEPSGRIRNQCVVLEVNDTHIEVQYFNFSFGEPTNTGLVSRLDFERWRFYGDQEEWMSAYRADCRRYEEETQRQLQAITKERNQ